MRLGLFVWGIYSSKGGTERFTANLANAMHKRGHSVTLFGQGKPEEPVITSFPVEEGIDCVNLALSDARSIDRARKELIAQKLDVFCAVYAGDLLLWVYPLLNNTKIPLIISEHAHPLMMDTERWNRYERLGCMAGADAIHMLSNRYAAHLPPTLKNKVTVIPNAVGAPARSNRDQKQNSRKVLLTVGRLLEQDKQYSILLKAFALLAARHPDWDLHFCGSGEDEQSYRWLAEQTGIGNRVVWHGQVEDVSKHYAEANLFCISSRYEGLPLALLEAQRYGLAGVGFAGCSGVNEVLRHGENGLLASEMTAPSLAAALGVAMANEQLRNALGEKAVQMLARYDETSVYDTWEELFRNTAECRKNTRLGAEPLGEDQLAKIALLEIMNRPHPQGRPDYLRAQKKDYEHSLMLNQLHCEVVAAKRLKSMEEAGIELARDLQLFPYPYPAPNKAHGIKRVALYIPGLGPGGAERQITTLAVALKKHGLDVFVLCNTLGDNGDHYCSVLRENAIPIYEIYANSHLETGKRVLQDRSNTIGAQWYKSVDRFDNFISLFGALADIRPDVLHCYLDDANCIGGIAGILAGVPAIVLSARSLPPAYHDTLKHLVSWTKPLYSYLFGAPQVRLEANSSQGAAEYVRWLGLEQKQCAITFNGINENLFSNTTDALRINARKALGIPDSASVVVWVGRHVRVKRPLDMLTIAHLVSREEPEVIFLVAGTEREETEGMLAYIEKLDLSRNVKILGRLSDMPQVYHAGDILLSTSAVEGFPNGIAEAMLCGLPVVATGVGATPELLNGETNGYLHEVGDTDAMARDILRLLNDRPLAAQKGRSAREYVLQNFLSAKLMEHELNLYETIIPPARKVRNIQEGSGTKAKKRVLLLADRPGWAYDISARSLQKSLADEFTIEIAYVSEKPALNRYEFDIVHVFWWGETYHIPYVPDPRRVVKEIPSHRWQEKGDFGPLSPQAFCAKHLSDAGTVAATSKRLKALIDPCRPCFFTPNGFNEIFASTAINKNDLQIGWAGNAKDPCKGLYDVLVPAAKGVCPLKIAPGNLSPVEMADFYSNLDVLCIASTYEGEPLTLLECMAAGCFPIATDVGIVPELIRSGENGLIVKRTPEAFREAFSWCFAHKEHVREAGRKNSDQVRNSRTWEHTKKAWRDVWSEALNTIR